MAERLAHPQGEPPATEPPANGRPRSGRADAVGAGAEHRAREPSAGAGRRERAGSVGAGPPEGDRIAVFQSRTVAAVFVLVPVAVAAVLAAGKFFPRDPMFATGLIAVIFGFLAFLAFASRIPEAFGLVLRRGLVRPAQKARYEAFTKGIENALNSRWSVAAAACGVAGGIATLGVELGGFDRLLSSGRRGLFSLPPEALVEEAALLVIWAWAGLAIWRMSVVAWKLAQLGKQFELRIQLRHPDRCGGFQPLGNLSLWNALILAVPASFLGWWIVAGPNSVYGTMYLGLDTVLTAAVVALAVATFIVPLWDIHKAMLRDAIALEEEVEQRGQEIDRMARELLTAGDELTPDERERRAKDLELKQSLYAANQKIATWPIDFRLVAKFSSSQVVPLLGLTGLGKPIVDVIARLSDAAANGGFH